MCGTPIARITGCVDIGRRLPLQLRVQCSYQGRFYVQQRDRFRTTAVVAIDVNGMLHHDSTPLTSRASTRPGWAGSPPAHHVYRESTASISCPQPRQTQVAHPKFLKSQSVFTTPTCRLFLFVFCFFSLLFFFLWSGLFCCVLVPRTLAFHLLYPLMNWGCFGFGLLCFTACVRRIL